MALIRQRGLALTGGLVVLLLGAPAGAGVAAYQRDVALSAALPAGARVGGVDVGRLDRQRALATVTAHFAALADRPATLVVGDREFTTTPRRLGVEYDVAKAVDRAFALAARGSWLSRSWQRLRRELPRPVVPVEVTPADDDALRAFVADVAAEVAVAPVDGSATVVAGFLRFGRPVPGRRLDTAKAVAALRESVADGRPREVGVEAVAPRSDASAGVTLLVRTGENRLYVYRDGRIVRTFGVATGSARYPTPLGRFRVTLKRYRPTWYNPYSSWSRNLPRTIGPGPDNPLGTRALNLDAPGIRIHGTPAAASIGYSVSHGCIRMRMADVEALYEIVPTGTTVFVVWGGPPRPMPRAGSGAADAADGG